MTPEQLQTILFVLEQLSALANEEKTSNHQLNASITLQVLIKTIDIFLTSPGNFH